MINIEKDSCCGCHACKNICPKQCIVMNRDEEGFLYPKINIQQCIDCGICEKVCPIINSKSIEKNRYPISFAVANKDNEIRQKSSSGGLFSLLAESVLENGGIVFGASMSEDCKSVVHIAVEEVEKLELLRGSKYVQSIIGSSFIKVREELETGRKVLFSGTPCQVEGLKLFLGKEYNNLLCVDFICHGVPSPKVWKEYIAYREKCVGASAKKVIFRNKKYGWKKYSLLIQFSNNKIYEQTVVKDAFLQLFISNICLRPSCSNCYFKKLNRESDITLADFWGVPDIFPDMDDDKGISLCLIHSKKGKLMFEKEMHRMNFREIDCEIGLKSNPSMTKSSMPSNRRTEFFLDVQKKSFGYVIYKYTNRNIPYRVINKLKRLIGTK